jgi:hypothetical protein
MTTTIQRRIIFAIGGFTVFTGILMFFGVLLECGSPAIGSHYWRHLFSNVCNTHAGVGLSYFHGVLSMITDIALTILPIPLILKNRVVMTKGENRGMIGIYFLAIL